jgi:hypothetical protein
MDGEFVKLRGDLADLGIVLNETSRNEHVGDIERFIRTLKERMQSIYTTLPFESIPPRMVIEMAKYCVYWLNAFPSNDGISKTISPRTIITGQSVDYSRHCKFQFGEYVQTHEEHDNTMLRRTIGALALHPTGNAQGSFYFYSLSTGRVINQAYATRLPMPDDIIERVNMMAQQQKANPGMIFLNRHNELVDQIDLMDNISYGDDEDEGGSDDNIDNQVHDEIMNEIEDDIEHDEVEIAGVGDDNGVGAEEENQEDNDIEAPADDEDEMILEQDDEDAMIPREEVNANDEHDTMEPDDGINEQEDEQQQIAAQMDDRYGQ